MWPLTRQLILSWIYYATKFLYNAKKKKNLYAYPSSKLKFQLLLPWETESLKWSSFWQIPFSLLNPQVFRWNSCMQRCGLKKRVESSPKKRSTMCPWIRYSIPMPNDYFKYVLIRQRQLSFASSPYPPKTACLKQALYSTSPNFKLHIYLSHIYTL